jgi:lipoprotein signal peptidase
VVDFIHVQRWPVFNLADAAICVGVALAGLATVRKKSGFGEGRGRVA